MKGWPSSYRWFHNTHETSVQCEWTGMTRRLSLGFGLQRDGCLVGVTYQHDRLPYEEGMIDERAMLLYLLVCYGSIHVDRYDANAHVEEDDW